MPGYCDSSPRRGVNRLMVGRGARRVPAGTEAEMAELFRAYGQPGGLEGLRAEADPGMVPTWADFAAHVAAASASI